MTVYCDYIIAKYSTSDTKVYLQVSEASVNRNRSTIIVPAGSSGEEGWEAFRNVLLEINSEASRLYVLPNHPNQVHQPKFQEFFFSTFAELSNAVNYLLSVLLTLDWPATFGTTRAPSWPL